ncbi:hypothetical protein JHD48_08135 [Sulfurimonas sp. SAG-AH-194-I05]|nr:hypothetical protein [Sulfurimonas sp. SAG-AH-194-I05]MDF1875701.1 hypothetical protein [Sulfurimonas sp. SAG-AH-194-I05]
MSSEFEAKSLQKASFYIQDKLDLLKKGGANPQKDNVYIVEDKKESMFQRFVGSIFHK